MLLELWPLKSYVFKRLHAGPILLGNPNAPKIALTFDDGPDNTVTPLILDVLKKHGVKATFFCLGACVNAHPDLVQREDDEGHAVCTHAYTHSIFDGMTDEEILDTLSKTNDAIKNAIGKTPAYFRPPNGIYNANVNKLAKTLGLTPIFWTGIDKNGEAVLHDFDGWSVDAMMNVLMSAQNGWIFLCHDGYSSAEHESKCSGGISNGGALILALDKSIPKLQQNGLTFVTIPDLLADYGWIRKMTNLSKQWLQRAKKKTQ